MSRMTSQSYAIARSTGRCAATDRELAPGDRIVTALVERAQEEGLDRLDYLEEAWNAGERPARLFGFWRAVVPEPNARRKTFIDDESLLALFEQLGETDDPKRLAFRFVLTLILIRKRLLRHEGSRRRDGASFMLVRMRGAEGWETGSAPIEVADPAMDETTIAEVTAQLGAALRGEE